MKRHHLASGTLELIIGCMYSGKSTMLLNKIRQHKLLDDKVLAINHSADKRYAENAIVTHDKDISSALCVDTLMPLLQNIEYEEAVVICIEEGQFFGDLYDFVFHAVENDKKCVIVSALDGDYNRKPFWNVLKLIPLADTVEKRNALCIECKDGTLASFSKKIVGTDNNERILIGGKDKYSPVCRYHYNVHI
jgi:thymidine kinase